MKITWFVLPALCCMMVCGGAESAGPAVPAARSDWGGPHSGWYTKLAGKLAGKTVDVLILGDSINMGWQNPASERGGKEVWEKNFWKYSMENFALSGDRTEHLLWRITEGKQLDGYKARLIILMIGINNAHQVRPGAVRPDTPAEAVEGLKAVLAKIREKQPEAKILLLGTFPAHFPGTNLLKWSSEFTRLAEGLADGEQIVFRDFSKSFLKDENTLKQELFNDGIHPSPQGFEVYAALLTPLIEEFLPGAEPHSALNIPGGTDWIAYCDYLDTQVEKQKGKTLDIVLLGDMELWGFSEKAGKSAWEESFGKHSVFNLAYTNDRTENLLFRIKERRQLEGYRARLIVIQAGMSNFKAGEQVPDSPAAVAYGVAKLVEAVRKSQPEAKILLLGLPAVHYPGVNLIGPAAETDTRLKVLADGKTVFFLETASFALNPDQSLRKELYENGLIFNAAGFRAFAEKIKPEIDTLLQKNNGQVKEK